MKKNRIINLLKTGDYITFNKYVKYYLHNKIQIHSEVFEYLNLEKFKLHNITIWNCVFNFSNIKLNSYNILRNNTFNNCNLHFDTSAWIDLYENKFNICKISGKLTNSTIYSLDINSSELNDFSIDFNKVKFLHIKNSNLSKFALNNSDIYDSYLKKCILKQITITQNDFSYFNKNSDSFIIDCIFNKTVVANNNINIKYSCDTGIPSEGEFIGFKGLVSKNGNLLLAKILILEDSRRIYFPTLKVWGASKIKVLEIVNLNSNKRVKTGIESHGSTDVLYKTGDIYNATESYVNMDNVGFPVISFYLSRKQACIFKNLPFI